jgi:hypothetical protein
MSKPKTTTALHVARSKHETARLVRFEEDDPTTGAEEFDLDLREFEILKQRLAGMRQPPPAPETNEQRSARVRYDTIGKLHADWDVIHSFLKRLTALEDSRLDGPALLGLLSLFEFHNGDVSESVAANYLGVFVFDLLRNIAWDGPQKVANDPDSIVKALTGAIEGMKVDVLDARNAIRRYPGILAIAEKEEAAAREQ